MKATQYLNKHQGIILESLEDFKKWFEEDEDKHRLNDINEAIKDFNEIEDLDEDNLNEAQKRNQWRDYKDNGN